MNLHVLMIFKILKTSLTAEIQDLISCDCVPGSEVVRVVFFVKGIGVDGGRCSVKDEGIWKSKLMDCNLAFVWLRKTEST